MIDLTTYALLRKQITTAASGVSDVRAEGDELVFVLADGHEVRVAIPATEIRDAVVRDDVLVLTLEDDKEVMVDATLTQSGQAADAKVTGDVVSQLKSDMTAKADKAALTRTDRSLDALWKLNQGISYDFQTDAAAAYAKQVPRGAKLASVENVGGKTVVWNQLYEYKNIADERNGVNFVWDGKALIANGTATNNITLTKGNESCNIPKGHKILAFIPEISSQSTVHIELAFKNKDNEIFIDSHLYDSNNSIIELLYDAVFLYYAYSVTSGYTCENVRFNPCVFDLTRMFGVGKEPATVAEFRAIFPEEYYPYAAPQLVSADVESVKYNDAIVAAIPSTVRALPGYGWSAGSVANTIERTENGWQYVQRVGSVDLGSLNWSKRACNSGVYSFFETIINSIADMKVYSNLEKWNSLIMPKYDIGISSKIYNGTSENLVYAGWDGRGIRVRDDAYTDAAAFKTAMSGVILYYELAEPIETDITEAMAEALEPFDVESGGSITFTNAAQLPVPNSIEYIVSLAEVGV